MQFNKEWSYFIPREHWTREMVNRAEVQRFTKLRILHRFFGHGNKEEVANRRTGVDSGARSAQCSGQKHGPS
jgi:hypothetical protein